MTLERIAYAMAVIAVLCVLTVFFCHAVQGPYSVVHGPVTALLSMRAASGLRVAVMRAGLNAMGIWLSIVIVLVTSTVVWITEFRTDSLSGSKNEILRC